MAEKKPIDSAVKQTIHKIWKFKTSKLIATDTVVKFQKIDKLDLTNAKFLTVYPDRNKKLSQQAGYEIVNNTIVIKGQDKEGNFVLKIKSFTANTLRLIVHTSYKSKIDDKQMEVDLLELLFEAD